MGRFAIALGTAGALPGGWRGRVLGLYRQGEAAGLITAVAGAVAILPLSGLLLPAGRRI